MKIIIVFLSVVFWLNITANAQDRYLDKSPEERAKIQTEWMQKELTLDSTCFVSVQAINVKYAYKMETIKNSNESRYSKLQEFKSLSEQKDEELKTIFTPEQYNLYQKKKGEMKDYLKQKNIHEN